MGRRRNVSHGRSQRARRGAVRDAVLMVLADRPMHGYELISELEARSSGRWRPSPGSIYPALGRMEERGLIRADETEDKKIFSLTDLGREARRALEVDDPTPELWSRDGDAGGALRALPAEIAGQARQLRRFGSSDQVEKAARLLEDAKWKLYAILADGPTPAEQAEGDDT